jgi:hypothetical protein
MFAEFSSLALPGHFIFFIIIDLTSNGFDQLSSAFSNVDIRWKLVKSNFSLIQIVCLDQIAVKRFFGER